MKKTIVFVSQGPFVNEQFADISSAIDAMVEWTKGSPGYPCRIPCKARIEINDSDIGFSVENAMEKGYTKSGYFVANILHNDHFLVDKWGDRSVATFVLSEEYLRKALEYATRDDAKLRSLWLSMKRAEDICCGEAQDKNVYRAMYDKHFGDDPVETKNLDELLEMLLNGIRPKKVGNIHWEYRFGKNFFGPTLLAEGVGEDDEGEFYSVAPKALAVEDVFYKEGVIKMRVSPTHYLKGNMEWRLFTKNGTPIVVFTRQPGGDASPPLTPAPPPDDEVDVRENP